MEKAEVARVRKHFAKLVQTIPTGEAMDYLMRAGIPLKRYEEILDQKKDEDRNRKVLVLFMKKRTYPQLIKLLVTTKVPNEVIDLLRAPILKQHALENMLFSEDDSDDYTTKDISEQSGSHVNMNIGSINLSNIVGSNISIASASHKTELQKGSNMVTEAKREDEKKRKELRKDRMRMFYTMEATMRHDWDCRGSEKYPRETFGFYRIGDADPSDVYERDDFGHVEEKIVRDLRSLISGNKSKRLMTITLFVNWSPCPSCVDALQTFVEWSERKGLVIDMTIRIAAFQRIMWPACRKEKCTHLSFFRHDEKYLEGILKLRRCGVKVKAFREMDWKTVGVALGLTPLRYTYSEGRRKTDHMVKLSLKTFKLMA